MKAGNLTTAAKRTALVILTVLFLAITVNAQKNKAENRKVSKAAIENLIAGIKSSNDGLKRDCIYFAAIYGIDEAVDVLVKEFKDEKNPGTRVLMALALYKLGVKTGDQALAGYVSIDWDARIRDIAAEFTSIYPDGLSKSSNEK